ncbi:MAG: YceK/YidQ family lipoprotein [Gammaproteobacteria bacterium]
MHKTIILILILIVSSYFLSGCSSIAVHSDKTITPPPYAGTKRATHYAIQSLDEYDYYGEFFIRAIDIPLSIIADTLLLPYDIIQVGSPRYRCTIITFHLGG